MSNSRTIHARISDRTILSCFKFIEAQGGNIDSLPLSSAVSDVLDYFVDRLIQSGKLPNVTEEDATIILDEFLGNNSEPAVVDEDPLLAILHNVNAHEDTKGDTSKFIETSLTTFTSPIEAEHKNRSPDEQILDEQKIEYPEEPPWYDSDILTFEEIRHKAPKDIYIEDAWDTNNEHLQRAIQLVYSNIPQDLWGTDKAKELLENAMPVIIHYLGEQKDDLA